MGGNGENPDMTPETIDPSLHSALLWTIIIASFALSALAAGMSVYLARRPHRRRRPGAASTAADAPLLRESEKNGRPVEETPGAVVARHAAPDPRDGAARRRADRRLEPRALRPRAGRRPHRAAGAGERPGLGAGAGDAHLRRHLDRAWQRLGRPADGRFRRPPRRAARQSRLHAAPRLADRRGIQGLLFRLRQ